MLIAQWIVLHVSNDKQLLNKIFNKCHACLFFLLLYHCFLMHGQLEIPIDPWHWHCLCVKGTQRQREESKRNQLNHLCHIQPKNIRNMFVRGLWIRRAIAKISHYSKTVLLYFYKHILTVPNTVNSMTLKIAQGFGNLSHQCNKFSLGNTAIIKYNKWQSRTRDQKHLKRGILKKK